MWRLTRTFTCTYVCKSKVQFTSVTYFECVFLESWLTKKSTPWDILWLLKAFHSIHSSKSIPYQKIKQFQVLCLVLYYSQEILNLPSLAAIMCIYRNILHTCQIEFHHISVFFHDPTGIDGDGFHLTLVSLANSLYVTIISTLHAKRNIKSR